MSTLATMYDDILAANVPGEGDGYAAYINGAWPDWAALVARFPTKPVKSITVTGDFSSTWALRADIADSERGDYSAQSAAQWAANKIGNRFGRPTIYTSTASVAELEQALDALGLRLGLAGDVDWWEAHWDGVAELSPGAIGKQYQSSPTFDVSVVLADWLNPLPERSDDPMGIACSADGQISHFISKDGHDIVVYRDTTIASGWRWFDLSAAATDVNGVEGNTPVAALP